MFDEFDILGLGSRDYEVLEECEDGAPKVVRAGGLVWDIHVFQFDVKRNPYAGNNIHIEVALEMVSRPPE